MTICCSEQLEKCRADFSAIPNDADIAVSICCITYNHEEYIAQAIESFLMQETTFRYEIIIGEDCSTDNTRRTVYEYASKYPQLIKVITSEENVGARLNGMRTRAAARGKYIALCEGDDYWTSPHKLQKQVDFLDSHPDFVICFHNVMVIYDNAPDISHPFYVQQPDCPVMQRKPKQTSALEDLVKGNYIQTPAVVFRAHLFDECPDWFSLDRADWLLHVLNAQYGNIGYIDEIMAVYRVHPGGIYSSKSRVEQLKGAIRAASVIDRHLDYQYHQVISEMNANRFVAIIALLEANGDSVQSRSYALKYLSQYGLADRRTMTIFIKGYFPGIWRLLRQINRLARKTTARHQDTKAVN